MSQEEHIMRYSYSGGGCGGGGGASGGGGGIGSGPGGGTSISKSKKGKQKKVPQRGLGVAQLERIRLEEQQKREALQAANVLANNAINSHSDSTPSSDVQCLSPSPNSLFRPSQSVPNIEIMHQNLIPISKQLNPAGGEIDSGAILSPRNENWPRFWNGEYNLEGEKKRLDHHGFAFRGQVNLPYESRPKSPLLNLPNAAQRSHHFQQPSFSSMLQMNNSSGISPSSVLSSQIEPPSNQSFRSNNYTPSRLEEDKVFGMKRPYPYSLESPPAPSFHCIFASRSRSDELAAVNNGYTAHIELRNKYIREGPSNSSAPPEPESSPTEIIGNDVRLNGDFLTLAPPASASQSLNSNHKNLIDYSGLQECELFDSKCQPSQENSRSNIHHHGPSGSTDKTFSFFPVKLLNEQSTTSIGNGNARKGDEGDAIDLNLKL